MENQNNTPIEKTLEKMDLVLPVGSGMSWKDELKYVLRSYCKNFARLGKVFIVGDVKKLKTKYPWLKGVELVDCGDPFNRNKDANMIRKVIKVIDNYELSEPFIRASDDQFVLRKVDSFPPMYTWDLNKRGDAWYKRGPKYKNRLKRTNRILFIKNKPTFNYDGHFPMEYNHDFKKVMESYPYTKSIGYTINSLYFNNVLEDHVCFDDCRAWINVPMKDEKLIKNVLKGKTYVSYSGHKGDLALTKELKNVIMNKFKTKCRFEK